MELGRLLRQVAPVALLAAVLAGFVWQAVSEDRRRAYPEELRNLLEQARSFQDNLRVALEPAFKPMALNYVRERYASPGVDIDIRSVSVRNDGRFPVIVEVIGGTRGLYRQEKFLFWWEREGWHMRYVEGDL
ncbi:MAG: hypothetical protein AB1609_04645 [Bacillota bacterium]